MDRKTIFTTYLVAVLVCPLASAAPGIPHQFYGSVYINNTPAPDYTVIKAIIDGDEYSTITKNGLYGQKPAPIFYIPDPDGNREGKTIQFYIGGRSAGNYTFKNAGYTELNFSITTYCGDTYCLGDETCSSCPEDCGTCTNPPQVIIYSPEENAVYNTTNIPLIVASDQEIEIWWYSLNSGGAVVFTPNTTIIVEEGENQIFVFAKNYQGMVGSDVVLNFTVELPQPECGNNIREEGEECDGTDFGGLTCSSYGYDSGNLLCLDNCVISTERCYNSAASSGQTGGGTGSSGMSGGSGFAPAGSGRISTCTPNWTCSEWSECIGNLQTRKCTDANNCGTGEGKPEETRPCPSTPCIEGSRACAGPNVMECRGGSWTKIETCPGGCAGGECVAPEEEAQNPSAEAETAQTGLVILDPSALPWVAVICGIIIVLAVYLGFRKLKIRY